MAHPRAVHRVQAENPVQRQVQHNHNPVVIMNVDRTYDEAVVQDAVTLTAGAVKVFGLAPLAYICILVPALPALRLAQHQ